MRTTLLLVVFGFVLAWTALRFGGVLAPDWGLALCGLGVLLTAGYLPVTKSFTSAPPDWPLYSVVAAFPAWAAVQLIPLPISLLSVVSPGRAALSRSLLAFDPTVRWAPISIHPEATRLELLHMAGYAAAFLVARDLMWRAPRGQWKIAAPVLIAGLTEAGIGLLQDAVNTATVVPSGTFVNRDHFSALLEMCLPFAAGGFVEYWLRRNRRPFVAVLLAASGITLLTAIAASLSRGGFMIALTSLAILGTIQLRRHFRGGQRVVAVSLAGLLLLTTIAVLASPKLLERFGDVRVDTRSMNVGNRVAFWKETIEVAAVYPVTGSGFGTFTSAVARFRKVAPTRTLEYAHNDGLQLMAEGGVVGAFIGLAGVVLLFRRLSQAWPTGSRRAELPLACGIAIFAALSHSLVDFTFHIPACALAFSWISGMSAGLRFSPPVPTHRPQLHVSEMLERFRR